MDLQGSDDWWWIDFLENELDPMLDKDLELLLEHSGEDRESFESFRLLKQWLKESDPIEGWPLDMRLTRMRANVMAAIAEPEVKPEAKLVEKPVEKKEAQKSPRSLDRRLDNMISP